MTQTEISGLLDYTIAAIANSMHDGIISPEHPDFAIVKEAVLEILQITESQMIANLNYQVNVHKQLPSKAVQAYVALARVA